MSYEPSLLQCGKPNRNKDGSSCVVVPNKPQQQPTNACSGDGYFSAVNKACPEAEGGGFSVTRHASCS